MSETITPVRIGWVLVGLNVAGFLFNAACFVWADAGPANAAAMGMNSVSAVFCWFVLVR